jgi:two-component sensor histidine kinase
LETAQIDICAGFQPRAKAVWAQKDEVQMTSAEDSLHGSPRSAGHPISIPVLLSAAGLALVYLAGALAGIEFTREAGNVAAIWPPNAVLLAVLLRSDIRAWPIYTFCCAAANLAANMLYGDTLLVAAGLALVNMMEVLSGCLLVRYACDLPIRLRNIRQLVSFAMLAGLIAPVIGAFGGAALVSLAFDAPYWAAWKVWWIAHAMGILIVAPPLLCWDLRRSRELTLTRDFVERMFMLLAAIVATSVVFAQGAAPWLFLIPPILIWAAVRMGLFVTAVAGLFVSVIAVSLTVELSGPIAGIPGVTINERILYLQLFLGTTVLAPLLVAVALAELKQAGEVLARWSETLELSNAHLETINQQRETLLKELQHRVKNNLQVVVSLLNLRSDGVSDPRARNAMLEASSRVEALALAHRYFYQPDRPNEVVVAEYVPELCSMLARAYSIKRNQIDVRTDIEDVSISLDQATPISLILNELISNAFKHAFPEGRKGSITITVRSELDEKNSRIGHITIRDDGVGMPEGFDLQRMTSIGLKVFLGLLRQIDGQVELERDAGTAFHVRFPLETERAA